MLNMHDCKFLIRSHNKQNDAVYIWYALMDTSNCRKLICEKMLFVPTLMFMEDIRLWSLYASFLAKPLSRSPELQSFVPKQKILLIFCNVMLSSWPLPYPSLYKEKTRGALNTNTCLYLLGHSSSSALSSLLTVQAPSAISSKS